MEEMRGELFTPSEHIDAVTTSRLHYVYKKKMYTSRLHTIIKMYMISQQNARYGIRILHFRI
jgi:hypothetical protein